MSKVATLNFTINGRGEVRNNGAVLIIGGSSEIGLAVAQYQRDCYHFQVIRVTRQTIKGNDKDEIQYSCDYQISNIEHTCHQIRELKLNIGKVIICNGLLHNDDFMPEKKLDDVNAGQLEQSYQANVIVPMLWLKQLPNLNLTANAQICVFSARVASIEDNRLGGWYSYRATKAALNMMTKTVAIELKRKHKTWCFLLFHPGTTATPLSKPFQANVQKDKLFTPEFVAKRLEQTMNQLSSDQVIEYLDWQGESIPW